MAMTLPDSFRSDEMEARYQVAKVAGTLKGLANEERKSQFKYWFMVENAMPYDTIAEYNDILVIAREAPTLSDLTVDETSELFNILFELGNTNLYSHFFIGAELTRSVKDRIHIHCIKQKKRYQNAVN